MILQNIWRRLVGNILINIPPLNISPNVLLLKRFHQNSQAVLAAMSINGLTWWGLGGMPLCLSSPRYQRERLHLYSNTP